jgi:NAD-dependent SIR2 family protein deacetylase
VNNFVENCDGLIVVGTALATGLAMRTVNECLHRGVPIVEVNIESSINKGNNIQLLGKSEETLPQLFKELMNLKSV